MEPGMLGNMLPICVHTGKHQLRSIQSVDALLWRTSRMGRLAVELYLKAAI